MSEVSLADLDNNDALHSGLTSNVDSSENLLDEEFPQSSLNRDCVEDGETRFSEIVESAISSIIRDDDPFSKSNFDVTQYVNNLFPTEQSLCGLDDVMNRVKNEIQQIDTEIADIVQSQSAASLDGQRAVLEAKLAIQDLFGQIREIKTKTDMSESMVKEITRDIKQLDVAKKNLTSSITTLNHLHMLLSGVELLQGYSKSKNYAEIANLLPGIMTVLEHFDKYLSIEQIRDLAQQVREIRDQITEQVVADFKDYFSNPFSAQSKAQQTKNFSSSQHVGDVCRVISVLDKSIKDESINWLIKQQLAEYILLFSESEDCAWLDKLDERYKWFCNKLAEFEEKYQKVFPQDWEMPRRVAVEFCKQTKTMLEKMMQRRRLEIDVKLLIFGIQRTNNFENLLTKRFPNFFEQKVLTTSIVQTEMDVQNRKNYFLNAVGQVFDSYMDIYVTAQDRNLASLIEQFQTKVRDGTGLPGKQGLLDGAAAATIPSSGDLFMVYKKSIQQTSQVTSGDSSPVLIELAQVFKKYLREYASKCLSGAMPKLSSSGLQTTSTAGLIQSLLKEGETVKLTRDETYLICCILTTAEFCAETIQQLQEKLKEKIPDSSLHSKLDMSQEQDVFHGIVSNSIQALVHDLESYCDAALQAMTKMQWSSVEQVGDESRYISNIKSHIRSRVPRLRDHLCNARKYFVQVCLKFATALVGRFLNSVTRCRPISVDGAEQLLLDAHSLKTELLNLPNVDSSIQRKPPVAYTSLVQNGMNRVEMILKLVMNDSRDAKLFIEQYVKLLPSSDQSELQKVLEMKGIRGTTNQMPFLDAYRKLILQNSNNSVMTTNNNCNNTGEPKSDTPPTFLANNESIDAESTIRRLEKLVRKRVL